MKEFLKGDDIRAGTLEVREKVYPVFQKERIRSIIRELLQLFCIEHTLCLNF